MRPTLCAPSPTNSEESKHSENGDEQVFEAPLAISPGLLKFHLSKTPLVLLTTFSYLSGNVIYHKIALVDKKIRNLLIQSFLLNQEICIG